MDEDVRWLQRLDSYRKACRRVLEITESDKLPDCLSELEQEGLVQRFEYTYELAWKVMQDFLKYKGYEFPLGPNGTLQKAFEDGLISNHDAWRRMNKARGTTSHTYNEGDALEIVENIYNEYAGLLKLLLLRLEQEKLNLEAGNLLS